MKKYFETPDVEMISIISEAVAGDLPGVDTGISGAYTPDD